MAGAVRAMETLADADVVALIRGKEIPSTEDVISVALMRDVIAPLEEEIFEMVSDLVSRDPESEVLLRFWEKFPPAAPMDRFFGLAPVQVKEGSCRRYYSDFLEKMRAAFSLIDDVQTSLGAADVYAKRDQRDEEIAAYWAGSANDAVLAKMLSARLAEKAAAQFYEGLGFQVEDTSIGQLDGVEEDWKTHDLVVGSNNAIDVKNARRPVNGKDFYVEHTVPRFKLDRRGGHVRIAGILSPYLRLEFIRDPHKAGFSIDPIVFLGETSQTEIDRLAALFNSPSFEVGRSHERAIPNWLFGYPFEFSRAFLNEIKRFTDEFEWPPECYWEYLFDSSDRVRVIQSLCLSGKPFPSVLMSGFAGWGAEFYTRLQGLLLDHPTVQVIFLAVLTDFVDRLQRSDSGFSPEGYETLLFYRKSGLAYSHPMGAIDPLGITRTLIRTLSILWSGRGRTNIARFKNFRLVGLGILQGREFEKQGWTTLVAYCGGTVYGTDKDGKVIVSDDGRPEFEKGKCGNSPLILGRNDSCASCRKLVCEKCGFCSLPCQERLFQDLAQAKKRSVRSGKGGAGAFSRYRESDTEDPRWEEVPWEAYDQDFRSR